MRVASRFECFFVHIENLKIVLKDRYATKRYECEKVVLVHRLCAAFTQHDSSLTNPVNCRGINRCCMGCWLVAWLTVKTFSISVGLFSEDFCWFSLHFFTCDAAVYLFTFSQGESFTILIGFLYWLALRGPYRYNNVNNILQAPAFE